MAKNSTDIGIQVYEILPDGCLNGVFANEGTNNRVFNEIAIKKGDDKEELIGNYDCYYFDIDNSRNNCDLEISLGTTSLYLFKWFALSPRKQIFEGLGWKTHHNQITIKYWGT